MKGLWSILLATAALAAACGGPKEVAYQRPELSPEVAEANRAVEEQMRRSMDIQEQEARRMKEQMEQQIRMMQNNQAPLPGN